jgi:rhodanese-related sulfurtransferase
MSQISIFRYTLIKVVVVSLLSGISVASAVDKSAVKEKWHTPYDLYLSPQEAYDLKAADPENVLMIDVRTRAEIQFVGFSDMADANIPIFLLTEEWKLKNDEIHGAYRKTYNNDFVAAVDNLIASRKKDKSVPIILMCQSGGRSPYAASDLHEAGYQKVYFQVEGFEGLKVKEGPNKGKRVLNGWKNAGLPWGYALKTEKMYFNFAPKTE